MRRALFTPRVQRGLGLPHRVLYIYGDDLRLILVRRLRTFLDLLLGCSSNRFGKDWLFSPIRRLLAFNSIHNNVYWA